MHSANSAQLSDTFVTDAVVVVMCTTIMYDTHTLSLSGPQRFRPSATHTHTPSRISCVCVCARIGGDWRKHAHIPTYAEHLHKHWRAYMHAPTHTIAAAAYRTHSRRSAIPQRTLAYNQQTHNTHTTKKHPIVSHPHFLCAACVCVYVNALLLCCWQFTCVQRSASAPHGRTGLLCRWVCKDQRPHWRRRRRRHTDQAECAQRADQASLRAHTHPDWCASITPAPTHLRIFKHTHTHAIHSRSRSVAGGCGGERERARAHSRTPAFAPHLWHSTKPSQKRAQVLPRRRWQRRRRRQRRRPIGPAGRLAGETGRRV